MAGKQATKQVSTFCPLCVSRCGAKATVTDGAFVALHPDPSHPTGQALCVKGKAAPELVNHAERLLRSSARIPREPAIRAGSASRGTRRRPIEEIADRD